MKYLIIFPLLIFYCSCYKIQYESAYYNKEGKYRLQLHKDHTYSATEHHLGMCSKGNWYIKHNRLYFQAIYDSSFKRLSINHSKSDRTDSLRVRILDVNGEWQHFAGISINNDKSFVNGYHDDGVYIVLKRDIENFRVIYSYKPLYIKSDVINYKNGEYKNSDSINVIVEFKDPCNMGLRLGNKGVKIRDFRRIKEG